MTLTIQDPKTTHSAGMMFGAGEAGSPSDCLALFLKQLKSGKWDTAPEKVSKSRNDGPAPLPPWHPMQGIEELFDDFRPFVGKRLRRVHGTKWTVRYEVEG